MKILALWDNYSAEPKLINGTMCACWLTDSCLLRERRPFYLPDFDTDFRLFPSLAIRLKRLGKCIPERFASRYWDEASVWLSIRACGLLRRYQETGMPLAQAVAFDNSVVSSPFFSMTEEECRDLHICVERNGEPVCEWYGNQLAFGPNAVISVLSKNTILKMGDVIMTGTPAEGVSLRRGDVIEVFLSRGGVKTAKKEQVTRFEIK